MSTLANKMGRLEQSQVDIERRMSSIESTAINATVQLTRLNESIARANGGLKMLISVGAVAGGIGAFVAQIINWMHK